MTLTLTNARIVLPGAVMLGTVVIEDDRIVDVQPGISAAAGALDLDGDVLMPAWWTSIPTIWSARCSRAPTPAGRRAPPWWRTMRSAPPRA